MSILLTPAYGRDYKSKKALLEDFDANKDFIVHFTQRTTLINKSQIVSEGWAQVQFRYGKMRKTFIHEVK